MITLVNKFLPLDKIPEVNNFIYGLVYDDMDFFYKLLKTGVDDEGDFEFLKTADFKLFKSARPFGKVVLKAGYNFLDIIRTTSNLWSLEVNFEKTITTIITTSNLCEYLTLTMPNKNNDKKVNIDEIREQILEIIQNLNLKNVNSVCKKLKKYLEINQDVADKISCLTIPIQFKYTNRELTPTKYKGLFDSLNMFFSSNYNQDYLKEYNEYAPGRFEPEKLEEVFWGDGYNEEIKSFFKFLTNLQSIERDTPVEEFQPYKNSIAPRRFVSMPGENGTQTEEFEESFIGNRLQIIKEITELYEKLIIKNKEFCHLYCKDRGWFQTKKQCVENYCINHPFAYLNAIKRISNFERVPFIDNINKELRVLVTSKTYKYIHLSIVNNEFLNKLSTYHYDMLKEIHTLFVNLSNTFTKLNDKSYANFVKHVKTQKKRGGRSWKKKRARKKYTRNICKPLRVNL